MAARRLGLFFLSCELVGYFTERCVNFSVVSVPVLYGIELGGDCLVVASGYWTSEGFGGAQLEYVVNGSLHDGLHDLHGDFAGDSRFLVGLRTDFDK